MDFCPECGGLLLPKKEGGKVVLKCRKCNYVRSVSSAGEESSKEYTLPQHIPHSPKDKTVIIEEEIKTMPTTRAECPKCGCKKAYYWHVQTRRADEAATSFFRCTECGHTWREY